MIFLGQELFTLLVVLQDLSVLTFLVLDMEDSKTPRINKKSHQRGI